MNNQELTIDQLESQLAMLKDECDRIVELGGTPSSETLEKLHKLEADHISMEADRRFGQPHYGHDYCE